MKCLFTFIFMLIFFFSCKEKKSYLVEYKFSYASDSLNKGNKNVENMLLHITDSGFVFLPQTSFIIDTAKAIDLSKIITPGKRISLNDLNLSNVKLPENNLKLFYKKDSNRYYVRTSADRLNYSFTDDVPEIKWNLLDDVKQINNYKAKKATTKLFGRNWEAWYTEEIKQNYGPYKFNGLPGLILELRDTDDNFGFEFVDLKIDTTKYTSLYKDFVKTNSTKKDFIKKSIDYKKNPGLFHKNVGKDTVKDNLILKDKLEKLKNKNNSIEKGFQFNL